MSKFCDYVFVLWGESFDETAATIFVSELREAGLRVKVVGLTPRHISGSHGLALVPDFNLDQALLLAGDAICIIVPYTSPGLKRLKNDPRLSELFQQANANGARFVFGRLNEADLAELAMFPISTGRVIIYPESESLVEFARTMAGRLSA